MPDYRDRLTVGELIDLVEYLSKLEGAGPSETERPALRRLAGLPQA
jgi:hypothetical protein